MAKCLECFFCKEKDEQTATGEKVKRCSVTGRKLTDESEACANIMRRS